MMKTVHVSLNVKNVDESITYYAGLFGRAPDVVKPGFAKWWLDDPRLNFALNERPDKTGLNHLGLQVEDDADLDSLYDRAKASGAFEEEGNTTCCYARSDKAWSRDPQGIAWELFLTRELIHDQPVETPLETHTACC